MIWIVPFQLWGKLVVGALYLNDKFPILLDEQKLKILRVFNRPDAFIFALFWAQREFKDLTKEYWPKTVCPCQCSA